MEQRADTMAGIKREEKEIYRQMVKYAGRQSRFILLALAAGALCAGCLSLIHI